LPTDSKPLIGDLVSLMANKRVLITGGTGLLGTSLSNTLLARGYDVGILSRSGQVREDVKNFRWDPMQGTLDEKAIQWTDSIVHLAGAGIADKRWSSKRKQVILDSRVKSGELIFNELKSQGKQLESFIATSAIGYYGAQTVEHVFIEDDQAAQDFQGRICQAWEQASNTMVSLGVRTVIFRVGVVLASKGGALEKMARPVRLGVGAKLGKGNQYISWIHIQDMTNLFIKALEEKEMAGTFNAVSSQPVTNTEFTKALARILHRPLLVPFVPAIALKLILGEMSEIILKGSRISSKKLESTDYQFVFPDLQKALEDLLR